MAVKTAIRVYLNDTDERKLERLCRKRNESKSALIRKLISVEKYSNVLTQIEINNKLNTEFLYQISQCGNNLNQIAYHLNADIENPNQVQKKLIEIINEFRNILTNHKKQIKSKNIDLKVKKIKCLDKELKKRKQLDE